MRNDNFYENTQDKRAHIALHLNVICCRVRVALSKRKAKERKKSIYSIGTSAKSLKLITNAFIVWQSHKQSACTRSHTHMQQQQQPHTIRIWNIIMLCAWLSGLTSSNETHLNAHTTTIIIVVIIIVVSIDMWASINSTTTAAIPLPTVILGVFPLL